MSTTPTITTERSETVLSFDEFKGSLGMAANKYTNDQLKRMWLICDSIADVVFDSWLQKRNSA